MKSHVPNCFTCCNLVCGCIATVLALGGSFALALLFIIIGAVFDFFDGFAARLLGVSSPIGKELDSLADCVTFGVAPSAMLYYVLTLSALSWFAFVAFLIAAFSALRLAKFNIDTRQATTFIGLPTPANALFWASLLTAYGVHFVNAAVVGMIILLVLLVISCYLLVCEVPMFAMKFKSWGLREGDNMLKYSFLVFSLVVIIVFSLVGNVLGSFALIILAYVLISIAKWAKAK